MRVLYLDAAATPIHANVGVEVHNSGHAHVHISGHGCNQGIEAVAGALSIAQTSDHRHHADSNHRIESCGRCACVVCAAKTNSALFGSLMDARIQLKCSPLCLPVRLQKSSKCSH